MKWFWGMCLLFSNRHLHILDKSHVKTYANHWIQIWKETPSPLTDLRVNEAWKSIIWCTENRHRNYTYCLVYKHTNYLILTKEDIQQQKLQIVGIVENPDNMYTTDQTKKVHKDLLDITKENNLTLDYSPMRNWSHGYYFYEYQKI